MNLTVDKREEKEQSKKLHQTPTISIIQSKNKVIFGRRKKEKERRRNLLGNSFLELIVIFQVLKIVFSIFCKHLADQKYP